MLKTYDREYQASWPVTGNDPVQKENPLPWPFWVIDQDGKVRYDINADGHEVSTEDIAPGKWVCHRSLGGKGMVIAVNDDNLTVLWSDPPRSDGFTTFTMPLVRRVFAPQIANQLISIQPMTAPVGAVFYMDYQYGDKWLQRCTTGPWPVRVFWKTCRSVKQQSTRIGTRLASWWQSAFYKSLPSSTSTTSSLEDKWAKSQVTPDVTKAIVDEWVNRNAAKAGRSGLQGR